MSGTKAILDVSIRSYWHPGTGRGSGSHLDALVHVDHYGLPRLPGRTLKGLIRDAVFCAETWRHLPHGATIALFGSIAEDEGASRLKSTRGCLAVSDATLPEDVARWLGLTENAHYRAGLFTELFSTAIDHGSGTAKPKSLRGMQVAVPLTLSAELELIDSPPSVLPSWRDAINKCLPLVMAVGANRSRGFGRAEVTLRESQ